MVRDPNFEMREQLREEVRPGFERRRIRWLLDQEFKNTTPEANKAISLMDEALRLKDSLGGAKQACHLAAQAYNSADNDRNIRYSAIDIFNTYTRQLLDAGISSDALDTCRFMEDLGLVDGITHRNFAAAYKWLGHPDEAVAEIHQAMRDMPDYVWFHIVAAECYILKALQQWFIYSNQREAQKYLSQAAEQLGRAYGRGDKEVQDCAPFFLSVIIATKLAVDPIRLLFGSLGKIGKSLNLNQQSLRGIRDRKATPQDAQDEVDRLKLSLRSSKPHQKELPEVYEAVMHALRGGPAAIQPPEPTYELNSPEVNFSCPNCGQTGRAPRPMRLQCDKCHHVFFVGE